MLSSMTVVSPLLLLTSGSLLVLMVGLWIPNNGFLLGTSLATLLGTLMMYASTAVVGGGQEAFSGLIAYDSFGKFFAVFAVVATALALISSGDSKQIRKDRRPEFYAIMLAMATGLVFMGFANHLLMIYLAIETVSILSFTLVGFNREKSASVEASMKYVVYGAMASALMVFGMSLVFGVTGEMHLTGLRQFFATTPVEQIPMILWIGTLLTFAGIGYKISAAPMHMWTPDVYEGAPTPVSAFLSVAPKAAGLALLIRFFVVGFSLPLEGSIEAITSGVASSIGFHTIGPFDWPKFIMISSTFTMFMGNLAALQQTSVKRILAYSSIAHAGYMLMGVAAQNELGIAAVLFYTVLYCTMNLGAFWIAGMVEDAKGSDSLTAFKGLGKQKTLIAVFMAVFLFSLVGLPPLAGFLGKLYLFVSILGREMYGFAVIAAVNSAISLYYYAKIAKAMFLEEAEQPLPHNTESNNHSIHSKPAAWLLGLLALPNVALILYWEPLLETAKAAVSIFTGVK